MNASFSNGSIKSVNLKVIGLLSPALLVIVLQLSAALFSASCGCNCVHQGDGNGSVPEASPTELMSHLDKKAFSGVNSERSLVCLMACWKSEHSALPLHQPL